MPAWCNVDGTKSQHLTLQVDIWAGFMEYWSLDVTE
jgi:hypothetical protein